MPFCHSDSCNNPTPRSRPTRQSISIHRQEDPPRHDRQTPPLPCIPHPIVRRGGLNTYSDEGARGVGGGRHWGCRGDLPAASPRPLTPAEQPIYPAGTLVCIPRTRAKLPEIRCGVASTRRRRTSLGSPFSAARFVASGPRAADPLRQVCAPPGADYGLKSRWSSHPVVALFEQTGPAYDL